MPKNRIRRNKFDSSYTKKKWGNKHAFAYSPYHYIWDWGCWMELSDGIKTRKSKAKQLRKRKARQNRIHHRKRIQTYFDDNYNDFESCDPCKYSLITEDLDYDRIPVWKCPICTYNNVEKLAFCSWCNHPYDFNTDNIEAYYQTIDDCAQIQQHQHSKGTHKKIKSNHSKHQQRLHEFEKYWSEMKRVKKYQMKRQIIQKLRQKEKEKELQKLSSKRKNIKGMVIDPGELYQSQFDPFDGYSSKGGVFVTRSFRDKYKTNAMDINIQMTYYLMNTLVTDINIKINKDKEKYVAKADIAPELSFNPKQIVSIFKESQQFLVKSFPELYRKCTVVWNCEYDKKHLTINNWGEQVEIIMGEFIEIKGIIDMILTGYLGYNKLVFVYGTVRRSWINFSSGSRIDFAYVDNTTKRIIHHDVITMM